MDRQRQLVWVLRLLGVIELMAVPTLLMPTVSMEWVHRGLGLGELPMTPVVEYLARSLSAFYAAHGVMVLFLSRDVERFAPVIRCWGALMVAMGGVLLAIDLSAGLPMWWTISEGPFALVFGTAIFRLGRGLESSGA
jgi:hypothetical protein